MSLTRNKVIVSRIHGALLQNLFNVHLYLVYLVDTFITLSMSSLRRPVLVSHHNNPREAGTATNCVIDENSETGTPEVTFSRSHSAAAGRPGGGWEVKVRGLGSHAAC